jgi:hypothetical protein
MTAQWHKRCAPAKRTTEAWKQTVRKYEAVIIAVSDTSDLSTLAQPAKHREGAAKLESADHCAA